MGSSDCERIGDGFLTQPVNAVSSLAFLPAGWSIARHRPDRRELAAATALVGVGSFLAHGPRWPGSHWLHDVTIAWVLTAIGLEDRPRRLRWIAYLAVGVGFAAAPRIRNRVSALAAGWVIARHLSGGSPAAGRALRLAGAGAVVGNLTRTDSPLCDPDSLLQGHAAWHALAAAALRAWGVGSGAAHHTTMGRLIRRR